MKLRIVCVVVGFLSFVLSVAAQTAGSNSASAQVPPPLIQFSNVATDEGGNTLSGAVTLTFSLYAGQQGGEALWTETQNNVQLDPTGHYSVQLGITKPAGVPTALFTTGEARWLGVQIAEQTPQPRVLLLSVPYALKAGDAATIGGLPPSAFVLAAPGTSSAVSAPAAFVASATATQADAPPATDVTGSGTADFIPLWTTTSNIGNSVLFQSGTGSTAKVGLNTTTPATTLDVKGAGTIRGTLSLPSTGTATATKGANSQPLSLTASAFNSSTSTAVNQTFQWQAEPANNDTSTASGTLNLLFGQGTAKPAETGLHVASNGQITFATGQTFPGTGDGTITGVTTASGSGLTGGGTSGTLSLSVPAAGITNTMLQNSKITLNAGTGLTAPGAMSLGDTYTVSINTSVVPQLAAANTFTGNQTVDGNLSATGVVTGSSYQIGSNRFAFGSYGNGNAFLGFAGNTTMTGVVNTAAGLQALNSNTSGEANTASGFGALYSNSTGSFNAASGAYALGSNTTGAQNTASGANALTSNTTGSDNTATGFQALSSNTTGSPNDAFGFGALYSNALGNYNVGVGYQALYSNVGDPFTDGWFNTAVGGQALYMNNDTSEEGGNAEGNVAVGYQALYSNTSGSFNAATGYQALYSNTAGYLNTASGEAALYLNTTGASNTAGGGGALGQNTTGGANTAIGAGALFSNTTGSFLTCVGFNCSADADGLSNATAIGAHARVGASNSLVLGGTGKYAVKVGIGTATPSNILTIAQGAGHPVSDSWETYSSRRWKTNIQTLPNALAKVEQLRGVSYDLKSTGKHEVGVIAEEVGAVVPEVVSYEENGKDARGVDYSRLTALLIEATKEQQREIQREQADLAKALRQIRQQQNLLRSQGSAVRSLQAEVREARESLRKVKEQVAAAQPGLVAAK
jgi:hypothetical protein